MRAIVLTLLAVFLAACRGYSLDMSGLETYSVERTGDTNRRLSVSELERAISPGMEDAGRGLTLVDAARGFEGATEKTNDRLNMSNLDRLSNQHMKPAGDGLTMSDLDRAVSRSLDPDNNKKK